MGRSRIRGSSTECSVSECGREASMVMRPSWGFAPWRKKRRIYELSYPVRIGLTSVIPTHRTGQDRSVGLTGYCVCIQ